MAEGKGKIAKKDPRITTPTNKQVGVINWDFDNNYPSRARNIIADSVTASNCLNVYKRFVFGRGLADLDFVKAVVNSSGEKADSLIRKIIADFGFINGYAVHINYNAAGEKTEFNYVKIDTVRLGAEKNEGKALLHPNWEKRKDKKAFNVKDIDIIDLYDPSIEAINEQVKAAGGWEKYKGQIFFFTPYGVEYTTAPWDVASEDMETEGGAKVFRHRAVNQNFMPSQYIIVDDIESEDPEAETNDNKPFVDVIVDTVKEFQGPENTGSVMVIQKPSPDTTFQMEVPDLQHFDGMYEKTERSTETAILRGFNVPRPLILEGDGLFSSEGVIPAASDFYNGVTESDRMLLAESFAELFSNSAEVLNPSGDYSLLPLVFKKAIPKDYFPYFTKNEIRESLDAPIAEESGADKKMLVETIGVGGTQALVAIITDTTLSAEQKKGTLKLLFNFSDEEANTVLGLEA